MSKDLLLQQFDLLATAPGGVAKLRELILTLAVQGKLVPQDPADEPASELLKRIRAEKDRLIAAGKIKRDKPLAELGEDEQPFELPVGWEWVRCGDYFLELCTGPFGSMIHQEDYVMGGVPLVNPSHMISGRIAHDPRVAISQKDAERLSAYALGAGDMVLARRGEVGRYALVTDQEHGWLCGTGSFFVRLHRACDREFLGLVFTDVRFRQHLQGESVGSTMTNLNQRILLDALIALPPLPEQVRIVARVEELMRVCDALEAQGQRQAAYHRQLVQTLLGTLTDADLDPDSGTPTAPHAPDAPSSQKAPTQDAWQRVAAHFDTLLDRPSAVDALEQTILQLAVRGQLVPQDPIDEPASELLKRIRTEKDRLIAEGRIKRDKPLTPIGEDEQPFELPKGWTWVRMGELIELISGQHLGPNEYVEGLSGDIPYLTGPAEFGPLSPTPTRSTKERRAVSVQGDILVTVKGSGVGKLNTVSQPELAISRQLMAIRSAFARVDFLYLVMQTLAEKFQSQSVGIAIPGIGRDDVLLALLALPPLPEQTRIVVRVAHLRRLCADLRQRLTQSQTAQTALAEALVAAV
jgi:type I restriction enzyme S subunit